MVALILAREPFAYFPFLILHITQSSSFVSLSTCLLTCLLDSYQGYGVHWNPDGALVSCISCVYAWVFFSCELFLTFMSTQLLLNLLSYIHIYAYIHIYRIGTLIHIFLTTRNKNKKNCNSQI